MRIHFFKTTKSLKTITGDGLDDYSFESLIQRCLLSVETGWVVEGSKGLNELNESLLDTVTNLSCSVLFSEKSWLYGDEPYWIIKNR